MACRTAIAVVVAVVAAGCAGPADDGPESGPSLDAAALPQASEGVDANATADLPSPTPLAASPANATTPLPSMLDCDALYLIDFGNPSVPPAGWVPEGYQIHSAGGSNLASYILKIYRCPDLLVDNMTLFRDVSFAYVAAILNADPGAPGALESHNLLMLEAYTDHDGFHGLIDSMGLPIRRAEFLFSSLPEARRVDITTTEGPVLQVAFQSDPANADNGADRSEGERLHLLNATGVHRWWDVFYLQNPANPSTFGTAAVQGGRPSEANPAGQFTMQGNGFDHRNVRGTIRFDGR